MTNQEWATKYFNAGFSVFPLWQGTKNRPLFAWKRFMTSKATAKEIADWWTQHPNANIAVVTGKVSNIIVFDTEKDFDLSTIQIPEGTPTVKTGSGGRHFYFKMPPDKSIGCHIEMWGSDPKRKADIKGEGGYVVAPPSTNDQTKGSYDWVVDLSLMTYPPKWLLDEVDKISRDSSKFHVSDLIDGVGAGGRNNSAAQYAGYLLQKSDPALWQTVCWPAFQEWNESNDPPLSDSELKAVFDSISKKEFGNRKGYVEEVDELLTYDGLDKVISSVEYKKQFIDGSLDNDVKFNSLLSSLDGWMEGFEGGELIVISGPTKNGKTSFCQTLTKNFEKQKIRSLWFTFEVPPKQLIKNFAKADEFFLPMKLRDHNLNWLSSRVRESQLKYDTRAIFIDHLHYLVDMEKNTNPSMEIGSIIRRLKLLAVELNIVIFLMAHTTKVKIENTPQASDVRDSSFIPQEADSTLMIWRKSKKDFKTKDIIYTGETMLIVSNHRRTGAMGKLVSLTFNNGEFTETKLTPTQMAQNQNQVETPGTEDGEFSL